MQAFHLQAPSFSKYLLLHFTAHFGSEPICAINNFRAFGVTEAEDLEEQLSALQGTEDINAHESVAHPLYIDAIPYEPPPKIEPTGANVAMAPSPHSTVPAVDVTCGRNVPAQGRPEGHTANNQGCVTPPGAHTLLNVTTGAVKPEGPDAGCDGVRSGVEDESAEAPGETVQPKTMPSSAALPIHASVEADMEAITADDGYTQVLSEVVEGRSGARVEARQTTAGTPKVLPHVFNEAVGIVMHGGSGLSASSPRGSRGARRGTELKNSRSGMDIGTTGVQRSIKPGAGGADLPQVSPHEVQNTQGSQAHASEVQIRRTRETLDAAVGTPVVGAKEHVVKRTSDDGSADSAEELSVPMDKSLCVDGRDPADHWCKIQPRDIMPKAQSSIGRPAKQALKGLASGEAHIDSGRSAEKDSKPHAAFSHHDTAQSKGGEPPASLVCS